MTRTSTSSRRAPEPAHAAAEWVRRTALGIGVVLWVAGAATASPEIPGAPQPQPLALVGGTIHPISGPAISDGAIVLEGGRIKALGAADVVPEGCRRIAIPGRHVYPGLIDAGTELGLVEIPSIRATVDRTETGSLNPNVRAQVAFNPDSELLPVTRTNGILTVLAAPAGGLVSGVSAVMHLDGWTWEDMALKPAAGLHVAWPRMSPFRSRFFETSDDDQAAERERGLRELRQLLVDARAYQSALRAASAGKRAAPDHDARLAAMAPVLSGELPIIVAADDLRQIQAALAFASAEKLKLIVSGGYDAAQAAEMLKSHGVPVIVGGVHRLPQRADDAYDAAFTLPERLRAAGVTFCISAATEASQSRNLPYHAATAAAYGLPADEALKAITLYPAQILGVADRIGSLEVGKDATLIVTTGDPLELTTEVEQAFIQGRAVDLSNKQIKLWEKYKEKYRRQGIDN